MYSSIFWLSTTGTAPAGREEGEEMEEREEICLTLVLTPV